MNNEVVNKLALLVKQNGGETYYVGGYVRDHFLNIESNDIDIEVHDISKNVLEDILNKLGNKLEYGKSFGVYSIEGTNIEIALPRKEISTGSGHKDFNIEIDPFIGTKEASRRRDFTINSMMLNVLTGELIDHYNGLKDLNNRILRHIDDDLFIEDPLRVLRAARFISKYDYAIDERTLNLCKKIDTSFLSKERVEEELKKVLLESIKPSLFFDCLRKMDQLKVWFKQIESTIGYKIDKNNDLFKHTMDALDTACLYRRILDEPYIFMLAVLIHDLGKLKTKGVGYIFYEHDKYLADAKMFLDNLISSKDDRKYALELASNHMIGHKIYENNIDEYESNKLFDSIKCRKELVYLTIVDRPNNIDTNELIFLIKRLAYYETVIFSPLITGQDLIDMGLVPNENFSSYLKYARQLSLKGFSKNEALLLMKEYINGNGHE